MLAASSPGAAVLPPRTWSALRELTTLFRFFQSPPFMKLKAFLFLAVAGLCANAHSAVYSTSFSNLNNGDNVAGQDGWVINDDPNLSTVGPLITNDPTNYGGIGYGGPGYEPATATVDLSHAYGEPIVNAENVGTRASFNFIMSTSFDGSPAPLQDTFGISLTSGAANVFSVRFTPSIDSTPTSPNYLGPAWAISYTVGSGTPLSYQSAGVIPDSATSFNLSFTPGHFNLAIGNLSLGGLTTLPSSTIIDSFHLLWTPTTLGSSGPNALMISNLTLVPEPSTSLLLCLTGLGLAARRRRP